MMGSFLGDPVCTHVTFLAMVGTIVPLVCQHTLEQGERRFYFVPIANVVRNRVINGKCGELINHLRDLRPNEVSLLMCSAKSALSMCGDYTTQSAEISTEFFVI